MSNMSYCRFRNTLEDLRDCSEHLDGNLGDEEEHNARLRLIELCKEIVDECYDETGQECGDWHLDYDQIEDEDEDEE